MGSEDAVKREQRRAEKLVVSQASGIISIIYKCML